MKKLWINSKIAKDWKTKTKETVKYSSNLGFRKFKRLASSLD